MTTRRTIALKEWLLRESERLGITERTHPMPEHRRVNCRVIEVFVDDAPTMGGLV